MGPMVLGIEGTAHTLGFGLVSQDGAIHLNATRSYRPASGGMHPREAADFLADQAADLTAEFLDTLQDLGAEIAAVAYSSGPGLGPCLRVAATMARALALRAGVPLLPVNHCVAHLEIGLLRTSLEDPAFLYASGGNTQVLARQGRRYRVIGETLDIGLGNLLDKFGRDLGAPFPQGPHIENLALEGEAVVDLPYSVKGMDLAYSGILTAARTATREHRLEDVCASLQEVAFAMALEVLDRGARLLGKDEVMLGGGVARNLRLREMTAILAAEEGYAVGWPEPDLCSDNGAMIAWNGILMLDHDAAVPAREATVDPRYRTDQVELVWA